MISARNVLHVNLIFSCKCFQNHDQFYSNFITHLVFALHFSTSFSKLLPFIQLWLPKRWFWDTFSFTFLRDIKVIDIIRWIHILQIQSAVCHHWIDLTKSDSSPMKLSGHKDCKPAYICLDDVSCPHCTVLHCTFLSSLRELFIQQVLCIVNSCMHLCSYINNEQSCIHRRFDSRGIIYSPYCREKCT